MFIVISIDVRNGLLDIVEVARGTVNGVEVHPRALNRIVDVCAPAPGDIDAIVVVPHVPSAPAPS